jgi:hypothetical protein
VRHVLSTPAGPVELVCQIEGVEPSLVTSQELRAGVRETWASPGRIEITFLRAEVGTPLHWEHRRPLDGFVGVVWTLRAQVVCGPLTFAAHLVDPAVRPDTAPNTGERLSAVTYETDAYALSIGTQDDVALHARTSANPGPWREPRLPVEWAPALAVPWSGEFGGREDGTGLTVHLPPLLAGQQADVHVAIGWGPKSDPDDVSTWFAVDTDPGWISAAAARPRA